MGSEVGSISWKLLTLETRDFGECRRHKGNARSKLNVPNVWTGRRWVSQDFFYTFLYTSNILWRRSLPYSKVIYYASFVAIAKLYTAVNNSCWSYLGFWRSDVILLISNSDLLRIIYDAKFQMQYVRTCLLLITSLLQRCVGNSIKINFTCRRCERVPVWFTDYYAQPIVRYFS